MEKLTQEQIDFLIDLGKKMNAQNNRMTAHVLFMVEEDVEIPVPSDWDYDGKSRSEYFDGELCESCTALAEENENIPDDCEDCPDECFDFYRMERRTTDDPGTFLTAEACDEHIRLNKHHYTNPKSYGVSAWRNYEMQEVQKILSILGSEDGTVQHNYK